MQVSIKNIFKLIGFVIGILVALLVLLVIVFHIMIGQRRSANVRERLEGVNIRQARVDQHDFERAKLSGAKPMWQEEGRKPAFPKMMTSEPRNLETYEGMYTLVKGNCGKLYELRIYRHNTLAPSGIDLDHVNGGWVQRGGVWATTWHVRDDFDGKTLHHQKRRRTALFWDSKEEDVQIDFSGFPEIKVKDRMKRSECTYTYDYLRYGR
jgi:hypothetical protein